MYASNAYNVFRDQINHFKIFNVFIEHSRDLMNLFIFLMRQCHYMTFVMSILLYFRM